MQRCFESVRGYLHSDFIGSRGNGSLMPKGSSSVRSGMREKAPGIRFSAPVCCFALARRCYTMPYSVRQGAHMWSLGLRSRLRKSHARSKKYVTRRKRLPGRNYEICPTLLANSNAFTSSGLILKGGSLEGRIKVCSWNL